MARRPKLKTLLPPPQTERTGVWDDVGAPQRAFCGLTSMLSHRHFAKSLNAGWTCVRDPRPDVTPQRKPHNINPILCYCPEGRGTGEGIPTVVHTTLGPPRRA